ncbi:DoxX family protein [Leisingera sp. S132]|uniref:DoxX family protein n=1 Tax=Leisingera sp. S132 TaxID=2867016 RepID=UPI0021A8E9B8|nr:DoxX family protein [Leisingera sp. S132]UWQ79660.1 DoxX family protein [Leisingera sp. S132]
MIVKNRGCMPIAAFAMLCGGQASGHEAWLLTPAELETLAHASLPPLFQNFELLQAASIIAGIVLFAAVLAEEKFQNLGQGLLRSITLHTRDIGPAVLRLGLAATLGLSALGGLPRHGTALWTQPTLFVPDMVLSTQPGWGWLAIVSLATAALLLAGAATQLAAGAVIVLSLVGCAVFGKVFILHYAGHFIAPSLLLMCCGGGKYSIDALLPAKITLPGMKTHCEMHWGMAQLLAGLTFVSLAITVKFMQPNLLVAILEHSWFGFFGIPLPVVALIMMYVEVLAGVLLIFGRLVRPIALFLLGAFTFFVIILGESPALHGNLYGLMFMFLLRGGTPVVLSVSWRRSADASV